jgi:hypothetical protein
VNKPRPDHPTQKDVDRMAEILIKEARKQAEVMSRPETDPERIQMEREERTRKFERAASARFGGFAYHMYFLLILAFTYLIADDSGWRIGIFCGLLMVAVLELADRLYLYKRH